MPIAGPLEDVSGAQMPGNSGYMKGISIYVYHHENICHHIPGFEMETADLC